MPQPLRISLSELDTHSVTIYPSGATVVREVPLKLTAGAKEVLLTDITNLAVVDSFRASLPAGSAVVTDVVPRDLPPPILHCLACPSDPEDDDIYKTDTDEEDLWPDDTRETVHKARDLKAERELLLERKEHLKMRISALDATLGAFDKMEGLKSPDQVIELLRVHEEQGTAMSAQLRKLRMDIAKSTNNLAVAEKRSCLALRKFDRTQTAARKRRTERWHVRREKEVKRRRKAEVLAKGVLGVLVTIEAEEAIEDTVLRLTYSIQGGVSWHPRYDLQLDTLSRSGVLYFRALVNNTCGEDWKNARVTLSTNQRALGGLEDDPPNLTTWALGLSSPQIYGEDGGLYSREERTTVKQVPSNMNQLTRAYAADEHGFVDQYQGPIAERDHPRHSLQDFQRQLMVLEQQSKQRLQQARAQHAAYSHRPGEPSSRHEAEVLSPKSQPHRRLLDPKKFDATALGHGGHQLDRYGPEDIYRPLETPATRPVPTSDPITEYSLGRHDVVTLFVAQRFLITEIPQADLVFSHVSVPKLRAAAYLRAMIRNNSKATLVTGCAGVTLDSTFLGTARIPGCSSGDTFMLPLGIDDTVDIRYSKPERHITTGQRLGASLMMEGKPQVASYLRTISVRNCNTGSRSKGPIKLSIHDQVPVSEDEKLRVALVQPGDGMLQRSGDVLDAAPEEGVRWSVALREGGQLLWEVELGWGKHTVLDLAYQLSSPGGMTVCAR